MPRERARADEREGLVPRDEHVRVAQVDAVALVGAEVEDPVGRAGAAVGVIGSGDEARRAGSRLDPEQHGVLVAVGAAGSLVERDP